MVFIFKSPLVFLQIGTWESPISGYGEYGTEFVIDFIALGEGEFKE